MASDHESISTKKQKEEELIQEFSLGQEKSPPLFPHFLFLETCTIKLSMSVIFSQVLTKITQFVSSEK